MPSSTVQSNVDNGILSNEPMQSSINEASKKQKTSVHESHQALCNDGEREAYSGVHRPSINNASVSSTPPSTTIDLNQAPSAPLASQGMMLPPSQACYPYLLDIPSLTLAMHPSIQGPTMATTTDPLGDAQQQLQRRQVFANLSATSALTSMGMGQPTMGPDALLSLLMQQQQMIPQQQFLPSHMVHANLNQYLLMSTMNQIQQLHQSLGLLNGPSQLPPVPQLTVQANGPLDMAQGLAPPPPPLIHAPTETQPWNGLGATQSPSPLQAAPHLDINLPSSPHLDVNLPSSPSTAAAVAVPVVPVVPPAPVFQHSPSFSPTILNSLGQPHALACGSVSRNRHHSRGGRDAVVVPTATCIPAPLLPPGIPLALPVPLCRPTDGTKLSRLQTLLRQQIEVFEATDTDITTHVRGRNKTISLYQVGIRCRHCAHVVPSINRAKGSSYFPTSVWGLYQASQNMGNVHLHNGACPEMPQAIKEAFVQYTTKRGSSGSNGGCNSGAGRAYWAESAQQLGLVDTVDGMFFIRNLPANARFPAVDDSGTGEPGVYRKCGKKTVAAAATSGSQANKSSSSTIK